MLKKLHSTLRFLFMHPLIKDNKVKILLKYFSWQVSARLLGKKILFPWVSDSKFLVGIGETGLTGNLYAGFAEFEEMLFVIHTLQSDEIFVDVGANTGAYTILAAKVIGAKTIAFEPVSETVERLKDQIQLNRVNDLVDVLHKGVGDRVGKLFFTNDADTTNKVCIKNFEGKICTAVTTLDLELDVNCKYFIKVDVEGFEWNVVQGAKNIFSSPNTVAVVIELNGNGNNFGFTDDDVHAKIISFGFKPIKYEPLTRSIEVLNHYNRNGVNTIYIKNIDLMRERCKSAPKRCVHTAGGVYI